jgi:hypothetical protein
MHAAEDEFFQVLMRSQNLNEAHKSNFFTAEVLEMSQK